METMVAHGNNCEGKEVKELNTLIIQP
jgi:hypothetical protein